MRKSRFFSKTRVFLIDDVIGENPTFSQYGENPTFSQYGENHVFSHFYRIPCFFQNFRVFKKFPDQSSSAIPPKNSVFFPKIPRLENY